MPCTFVVLRDFAGVGGRKSAPAGGRLPDRRRAESAHSQDQRGAKVKFTALDDLNVATFELHNALRVTKVIGRKRTSR